jgi:hypothetical protein
VDLADLGAEVGDPGDAVLDLALNGSLAVVANAGDAGVDVEGVGALATTHGGSVLNDDRPQSARN